MNEREAFERYQELKKEGGMDLWLDAWLDYLHLRWQRKKNESYLFDYGRTRTIPAQGAEDSREQDADRKVENCYRQRFGSIKPLVSRELGLNTGKQ